jgi:hypothetical protein
MQPGSRWNIKARIQAKDVCHVIVKKMSFCSGHHEINAATRESRGFCRILTIWRQPL